MANAWAEICETCAKECEKDDLEHCKKCAQAYRPAAAADRKMAKVAMATA